MSRKRKRDVAPIAPREVGRIAARKWAFLGRRDARRYGALLDFTPTHSLLRAEGEAQQGQHAVNAWLIEQVRPDITGNERIAVSHAKASADLAELLADRSASARVQHQNSLRIERLRATLANMEAQRRANVTKARGAVQTALEAIGTWEKYYFQVAAVYTRARANARGESVSSVSAEVPAMRSVPVVEIEGLEEEKPSKAAGGRK